MFELTDAVVAFGGRRALGPVTARLWGGTSVALMGPNGSGKTTLLRLLAGLNDPVSGAIERPAGGVSYVAQHQHQHRWLPLTVREVVTTARYRRRGMFGPLRRADRVAVADALDRLEVGDLTTRTFGELSGGQRQRVLVATAIAGDVQTVLLDEPITGLDLRSQRLILEVVEEERLRERLVVLSTHHLDEAKHCDRVMLLNTSVVADGPPDTVLVPGLLAAAFGVHSVRIDGDEVEVVDDHGHGTPTQGRAR